MFLLNLFQKKLQEYFSLYPQPYDIDNTYYLEIVKWRKETNGLTDAYCFTIESFIYDKDGYPELHYCGNRPLDLNSNELAIFHKLIKEGYNYRINEEGEITDLKS